MSTAKVLWMGCQEKHRIEGYYSHLAFELFGIKNPDICHHSEPQTDLASRDRRQSPRREVDEVRWGQRQDSKQQ